ncbi:proopiomelanocortin b [Clarias gariepinus]|uniref:proopiomelanocortin b n=1 Tax=Clarias gariepinus TaxID=13013 RepID=UPI00234DF347|nr:proopiomelanocortin b [Clarias gariepinus]
MKKMRCVSWLSAALLLCVCGSAVDGRCWDLADCHHLDSHHLDSHHNIIECIWECRLKLLFGGTDILLPDQQQGSDEDQEEEENSLGFGILLPALSPPDASRERTPSTRPERSEDRLVHSMEHFRWGKPVSRKRRPVKVHTAVYANDEYQATPPMEMPLSSLYRRQLEGGKEQKNNNANAKGAAKYRITHFRWSAPPPAKRYGGFMRPWSERSNKPLLTLLRNIIAKNVQ